MGMKAVLDGDTTLLKKAVGVVNNVPIEVIFEEDNEKYQWWVKIRRKDKIYGYSPELFSGSVFKFLNKIIFKQAEKYFYDIVDKYNLKIEE